MRNNLLNLTIQEGFRNLCVMTEAAPAEDPKYMRTGCIILDAEFNEISRAIRGEQYANAAQISHAEEYAISKLTPGQRQKATYLLTGFEPCTTRYFGKAPCSDLIKTSQIPYVFYLLNDPNPTIHCQTEGILKQAGIHVARFEDKETQNWLKRINEGFYDRFKPEEGKTTEVKLPFALELK